MTADRAGASIRANTRSPFSSIGTRLFLASFLIRLALLVPIVARDMPPIYDERGYLSRANGFVRVFQDLARLESPVRKDLERIYGRGVWPPLHPALLGAGILVSGGAKSGARLAMVLVSAATTLFVYRIGLRLASRKAAIVSAAVHALHPSFVAFSHFLWPETTFIFFLLSALYAALAAGDPEGGEPRRWRWALVCGASLGAAGLARASVLPFMAAIPLWTAYVLRRSAGRLMVPAIMVATCLVVVLPWQAVLGWREGRLVPLSTADGYNLYIGNNPWIAHGQGSSFMDEAGKRRLEQTIHGEASRRGVSEGIAARDLALREIRRRPGTFVRRVIERLRLLWTPDIFVLRHLVQAGYPPVGMGGAWLVVGFLAVAYLAFLILAARGLMRSWDRPAHKGLVVLLVVAGSLPNLISLGTSRHGLPLLAVLLPAIGYGATGWGLRLSAGRRLAAWGLVAAGICGTVASIPALMSTQLAGSSLYAGVLQRIGGLAAHGAGVHDQLAFRRNPAVPGAPHPVRIRVLGDRYRMSPSGGREDVWDAGGPPCTLRVFGSTPVSPLELLLGDGRSGAEARLAPVDPSAWRRWRPTGLEGIEVQWVGGADAPPSK